VLLEAILAAMAVYEELPQAPTLYEYGNFGEYG
jgi:hypothetical protein